MKLDPKLLKYMTKDQFRVLSAVEQGSKNHFLVPLELIVSIAGLRHGGAQKIVNQLLRNKLVARNSQKYEGYRLTYLGYDFLALRVFLNRGTITGVGRQIGVGKESDIYLVQDNEGKVHALKLHRLGRVSFKAIKQKRDYLQGRHKSNWLYLSRLAATKEYAFMCALREHDFPVPKPIDHNRHCVVMELCQGYPLYQVKKLHNADKVYREMLDIVIRFARYGLIHCDFNEFNLMINDEGVVTVIDFPQMISTDHENAPFYFNRDVQCVRKYFGKILGADVSEFPKWGEFGSRLRTLDSEVKASGFDEKAAKTFDNLIAMQKDTATKSEEEEEKDRDGILAKESDAVEDDDAAEEDDAVVGDDRTPRQKELTDAFASMTTAEHRDDDDDTDDASRSKKKDGILARVRAQRQKKNARQRHRRTAGRNRNKNRAKKDLKREMKQASRRAASGW